MFKYFNNSPNGNRVGDCVVRAIATILGQSWGETYIELCLQGYLMSDLPSSNAVWNAFLKNKGFSRKFIGENCTILDFAEGHPVGSFVVGTGTHATAVIDGCILDTWDCGDEQPLYFYVREELE